jgi:hypothetical protein
MNYAEPNAKNIEVDEEGATINFSDAEQEGKHAVSVSVKENIRTEIVVPGDGAFAMALFSDDTYKAPFFGFNHDGATRYIKEEEFVRADKFYFPAVFEAVDDRETVINIEGEGRLNLLVCRIDNVDAFKDTLKPLLLLSDHPGGVITRSAKGEPLTHEEMDANFVLLSNTFAGILGTQENEQKIKIYAPGFERAVHDFLVRTPTLQLDFIEAMGRDEKVKNEIADVFKYYISGQLREDIAQAVIGKVVVTEADISASIEHDLSNVGGPVVVFDSATKKTLTFVDGVYYDATGQAVKDTTQNDN